MKHAHTFILSLALMTSPLVSCSERAKPGTVNAVRDCVKKNANDLLLSRTIKNKCVKRHEFPIVASKIDGYAAFDTFNNTGREDEIVFRGSLKNLNEDMIITSFGVHIIYYDETGSSLEKYHEFDEVWIEPNSRTDFTIDDISPLSDSMLKKPGCPDRSKEEAYETLSRVSSGVPEKSCWNWGWMKVKAVSISLD